MPERYGRVVAPIYHVVGNGYLAHLGTGVLLKVDEQSFWVASARHVLDDERGAVLPGSIQFPSKVLSGWGLTVREDPADIGIARLSADDYHTLVRNGYSFLPMDETTIQVKSPRTGTCILSGYPVGTVELDGDERTAAIGTMHAKTDFVPFSEPGKIAATFDQFEDDGTSQPITTPDPHGLSGGAMWHVDRDTMKLVGIVGEWDPRRKLIVGTTIRAVLQGINWKLKQGENS
jgi:hypothetical protein